MPTDLKLGSVQRRVLMCRSLNEAELRLISRISVVDVERQFNCSRT